jgi:hypothetical protein
VTVDCNQYEIEFLLYDRLHFSNTIYTAKSKPNTALVVDLQKQVFVYARPLCDVVAILKFAEEPVNLTDTLQMQFVSDANDETSETFGMEVNCHTQFLMLFSTRVCRTFCACVCVLCDDGWMALILCVRATETCNGTVFASEQ